MKKVIILTSAFPYLPGEQFIEDEISYWGDVADNNEIIVLPASSKGQARNLPGNVTVDLSCLAEKFWPKWYFLFYALTSKVFISELFYIINNRGIRWFDFKEFLRTINLLHVFRYKLRKYLRRCGSADVIYCYWNDAQAYAACMLKKEGLVGEVVTRMHGFDLYEERRVNSYMPLKRQFISQFDKVFVLSKAAENYVLKRYRADPETVKVRPLAVPIPERMASRSPHGEVSIVSVSFCVGVKRIDKIIDALEIAAQHHPTITFFWNHIGGGPLLDQLKSHAARVLAPLKNINFNFRGTLTRDEVRHFYLFEMVDCILNASESEGMPVSIMEAMSFGVPAIAPDIGGISDLINSETGMLLRSAATPDDIATAIGALIEGPEGEIRARARLKMEESYNAAINYRCFVNEVLGGHNSNRGD